MADIRIFLIVLFLSAGAQNVEVKIFFCVFFNIFTLANSTVLRQHFREERNPCGKRLSVEALLRVR